MSVSERPPTTLLKQSFDDQRGRLLITALDSSVIYISKSAAATTGHSVAEVVGSTQSKLWGAAASLSLHDQAWQEIKARKTPLTGTYQYQRKNGSLFWSRFYITPIFDDDGETLFFLEFKPPNLHTEREHHNFGKLFIEQFSSQQNRGVELIEFICHSLTSKGANKALVETVSLARPVALVNQLGVFLNDTLVAPTERLFESRNTDRELIKHAQLNHESFDSLYGKYLKEIQTYFAKRLAVKHLAEDLAQETFINAYKSLAKFVPANSSYVTYLKNNCTQLVSFLLSRT